MNHYYDVILNLINDSKENFYQLFNISPGKFIKINKPN